MENKIYCVVIICKIQDCNMENVFFAAFQIVDTTITV